MKLIQRSFLIGFIFSCFVAPTGSAGFLDDLTQTLKAAPSETPADPSKPFIAVSGAEFKGQVLRGENAPDASFRVKNIGAGALNFTAKSNIPWVEVSPTQGTSSGGAEQRINLRFKTADLKEGNYVAPIVIEGASAQNSPRTVLLRLEVLPSAVLVLDKREVSLKSRQGEKAGDQTFVIRNQGAGNLSYNLKVGYSAADETGWLLLNPGRGDIPAGQQVLVTASFNASKFSAGMHMATVIVEAPGASNSPQSLQVNLQVMSDKTLSLGVKELKLESTGKPSGSQVFRIENTGTDPLNYEIKSKEGWLSAMPLRGALAGGAEAAISVQYDTSKLKPGVYESEIEVRQQGSEEVQKIPVKLEVAAPPAIGLQPSQLNVKAAVGKEPGGPTVFTLANDGEGKLQYTIMANAPWLGVESPQGILEKGKSSPIALSIRTAGLQPGEHKAEIQVSAPGAANNPQTIPVSLSLEVRSQIEVTPGSFSPQVTRGAEAPAETFEITNSGGAPFSYTLKTNEDWLKAEPAHGTLPAGQKAAFQVIYKTKDLGTGDYATEIEVSDSQGEIEQKIPVKLTVKAKAAKPSADSSESVYVEPGKTVWDVVPEGGKTELVDAAVGPLKDLVVHLGNAENMHFRSLLDPHSANGDENVKFSYDDVLTLQGTFPYKDETGYPRTLTNPKMWDMDVTIQLFSPRAARAGFAKEEYYLAGAPTENGVKLEQIGTVPGAELSAVYHRANSQNGKRATQDYFYIYALKDGVFLRLRAQRELYNYYPIYGGEKELPPFAEEILKRVESKSWLSFFKPDKGDPRFDRLPEKLKPLIRNMGELSPTWIGFSYNTNNGQPKGWDYKTLALSYLTCWTAKDRKEGQSLWRCDVNFTFYYPNKTGRDFSQKTMKDRLEGYKRQYPDHQETKLPHGDESYQVKLYSTGNDGKRYSVDTHYIARVGTAICDFDFSGVQDAEPPKEIFDEAVNYLKENDIEELFASADRVINLSGEERPSEETAEPEDPEAEEPPVVLPDDAFWQPESEAVELPVGQITVTPPPGVSTASGEPVGPKSGEKNGEGKVWSPVAGGGWVKPEIYESDVSMIQQGKVYTDQWGWVDEKEAKEKQANYQKFQAANQASDQKRQADLQKMSQDIRDTKQKIKDSEAKREKVAQLREKLDRLEENMKEAANDARWNSKATMTNTAQLAAREIVTGSDAEGGTSYKAMALRMLMGGVTAGYSEVAYNTADASYQVLDHLKSGDSIMGAVAKTTMNMATSEVIGRAQSGLMFWGAKKASTVVRTAFGQAAEVGTEGLSKSLAKKKTSVEKVLAIKDDAARADAIKRLYRGGGMEELSQLERKGHLGANDVKKMNQVISQEVNAAVDAGVKKTMTEFEKNTGVKIKEVMVGDSGSSASRKVRSVKTDADIASLPQFEKESLKSYADKFCGGDIIKANDKLSKKFAKAQDAFVDDSLRSKGLSAHDVGYQTYDRFGSTAGPGDAYTAGFVRTRQATQGKTTVFKPSEGGEIKSYKTSGQAMTDQDLLTRKSLAETELKRLNEKTEGLSPRESAYLDAKKKDLEKELKKIAGEDSPKIDRGEAKDIMKQQEKALRTEGLSAEKASKALDRADKALALSDNPRIDPALREKARLIRQNPQQAKQILGNMSEDEFIKEIDDAVGQAGQEIQGH